MNFIIFLIGRPTLIYSQFFINTKQGSVMFSFSHSSDDAENTPFFSDNEEKPSIFNSQVSDEPSAFDLFNNVSSNFNEHDYRQHREKGRQSKKSIIMELDEFDRKQAFSNLNQSNDLANVYSQAHSNPNQKNIMAESVVKHFESNQVFPDSQFMDKTKGREKDNEEPAHKFLVSFNPQNKDKQKRTFLDKFTLKTKPSSKGSDCKIISQEAKGQEEKQRQAEAKGFCFNPKKNAPNEGLSFGVDLKKQQANTKEIRQQKQEQKQKKGNHSIFNSEAKPEQGKTEPMTRTSGKQFTFSPLHYQSMLKPLSDLRSSRVVEDKKEEPNTNPLKQDNPKVNFSSIFKKSRVVEPGRSVESQKAALKVNYTAPIASAQTIQPAQQDKKPQEPLRMFNLQAVGNNQKPTDSKAKGKEQTTGPAPKHSATHSIVQKDEECPKKEENGLLKTNKIKQKPCFNLKLLKEPARAQRKTETEKKNETNNLIKEQQMSKREDIATAKLLKNMVFTGGMSFQAAGLAKLPNIGQDRKSAQDTPKLPKAEQSSLKMMQNRETEKIKYGNGASTEPAEGQSGSPPKVQSHRIDFEKYENEIECLQEEIEQTKKKYLACDQGFKQIFLLMNRANAMLSEKFLSQTQGNEAKQKSH